jgi:hypothetical protein
MQLCFPWRRWSSRSSGSALTKTVEDDECETIQVNQTKSDPDTREIYGFSEAAERIKKEFELSDDDVRRIVGGFVEQMSMFMFALLAELLMRYQTKDYGSQVKRSNNYRPSSPNYPQVVKW